MARASDPGGPPRVDRRYFAHLKIAKIPGVTSKFGISSLEVSEPSLSVHIGDQFHIPRFLAIKLF